MAMQADVFGQPPINAGYLLANYRDKVSKNNECWWRIFALLIVSARTASSRNTSFHSISMLTKPLSTVVLWRPQSELALSSSLDINRAVTYNWHTFISSFWRYPMTQAVHALESL